MPLPRFARLPDAERARILTVATDHLARRGAGGISLNELADEAGISRSALYNYFDGRDDLVAAVADAASLAVAEALGEWQPQADEPAFWAAFQAAFDRLQALLADRPELRAVLTTEKGPARWLDACFADAVRLGLVTAGNQLLVRAATAAVIAAADALELAQPGATSGEDLQHLLQRIWT